jgi:intergrase/recombinase
MSYIKVSDFDRFKENPFIDKVIEDIENHKSARFRKVNSVGNLTKEAAQTVVNKDGEVTAVGIFMQYIEVDEKQFAKVYLNEISIFWELNKAGQKILVFILTKLKPNSDLVLFSLEECLEHTGYKSKKNVIEGLADLLQKELIAKSIYENAYFINPMVIFNGDRITYAKTYIKKKREKELPGQLAINYKQSVDSFENKDDL